MKAYLDIETSYSGDITVVGILRADGELVQIVGSEIDDAAILEALEGVDEILTFNGLRFDLPLIQGRIGLDLRRGFLNTDLMYRCRKLGLRGGLKKIEEALGISRRTQGLDGRDAMRLWQKYLDGHDEALELLLDYNRDDIVNLFYLERTILEQELNNRES